MLLAAQAPGQFHRFQKTMSGTIDPVLEKLYSPRLWTKRTGIDVIEDYEEVTQSKSGEAKERFENFSKISYGKGPEQYFKVFGLDLPKGSPVKVFIHGGYWQHGSVEDSLYFVPPFYEAGFVCISVGHDIAPGVSLTDIVNQVETGIKRVVNYVRTEQFGDIWLSGHSSGAHLAIVVCQRLKEEHLKFIKGILSYSGVYDLEPLVHTSNNDALNLTEREVQEFSPLKLTCLEAFKSTVPGDFKILVVYSEHDSPAFIKEAKQYHEALSNLNCKSHLIEVKGLDHFQMMTNMYSHRYKLIKVAVKFMKKENDLESEVDGSI